VLDNGQYKFVPADITVKAGDAIEFVNVSGGPHNVAFKPEDLPNDVAKQLDANMPAQADNQNKMGTLSGPLLTTPNVTYKISFAGIKPGKYPFHCTPHEALGMKGTITVQ
jgi:plastocyanin